MAMNVPNLPLRTTRPRPSAMRESTIQAAIREALGLEPDLVLFRNSIAMVESWNPATGQVRRHRAGLVRGSSDLIGILKPGGRWFALEVKSPTGTTSDDQAQFLALVRRFGGFAAVVHSVCEAVGALDRARLGAFE